MLISPMRPVIARGLDKDHQLLVLALAAYGLTRLRAPAHSHPQRV
jgi:hypothetical protein